MCCNHYYCLVENFSKAGEPGWKVLIPFYNMYTAYKLFWKKSIFFIMLALGIVGTIGYFVMLFGIISMYMFSGGSGNMVAFVVGLILLLGCSVTALVLQIIFYHRISKAFGHGGGFTVGLVFLSEIFFLILAFGSSRYIGGNQTPQTPQGLQGSQVPPQQGTEEEPVVRYTYKNPME